MGRSSPVYLIALLLKVLACAVYVKLADGTSAISCQPFIEASLMEPVKAWHGPLLVTNCKLFHANAASFLLPLCSCDVFLSQLMVGKLATAARVIGRRCSTAAMDSRRFTRAASWTARGGPRPVPPKALKSFAV
eukprot:CAMPEP_0197627122 /NCGR_PEP_ID=MMETSP1338-20131121/5817_1 /TAXON_ID=43686 ORGANISM="Pelagodinium beii, Strain RCC1491" /NCGR_SAMPLE_ID=MMETSP1338 /ASSEMBLY_ACC=CAM_ASM_000754 /LENGTH=133 /DNA_ID=CAMNT_0043197747 /DNA_START=111 /DNA_END=514 /DNA_ORIENTATION=-